MNTTPASEIAAEIIRQLKEKEHVFWIDPEIHANQHEFIQLLIDERKHRKARRDRLGEVIAGSIILSAILGLLSILGIGAISWLKSFLK